MNYEQKLRRVLEILEFREIDKLMESPIEDVEQIVEFYTKVMKTTSRRNDQLQEELKHSFDRRDMMEFAEYVARLYDLDGMTKWTDKGDDEKLDKTVNDILNEFEKEREISGQLKSSDMDGKDLTDILYSK